jgi:hypothetical protein
VTQRLEDQREQDPEIRVGKLYEALMADDEGQSMKDIMEEINKRAENRDEPHNIALDVPVLELQ